MTCIVPGPRIILPQFYANLPLLETVVRGQSGRDKEAVR